MRIPKWMVITPGTLDTPEKAQQALAYACKAGVAALQLRERQLPTPQLLALADKWRQATAQRGIFLAINERLDIALAVQAAAIHLPEQGLPASAAKKVAPQIIVGVSVHSLEAALIAEHEGADYLLVGPVFAPISKKTARHPLGLSMLSHICQRISIPVLAVGGITLQLVRPCLEAGAYGFATIGSFWQQQNEGFYSSHA